MNEILINRTKEPDAAFLEGLSKRVSQHIDFFKALEDIRWKFTSALGVGALTALIFVSPGDTSRAKAVVGLILAAALSLAGIVTQMRIYALIVVIWNRILILQQAESLVLCKRFEINDQTRQAFFFPRIGVLTSPFLQLFTVGMASCFVFSLIIGLAASLAAYKLSQQLHFSAEIGIGTAIFFAVFALVGSKLYVKAVQSTGDHVKIST